MGRRSVAETAYQNYEEKDAADIGEGVWLVLYDFKGVKPNPRFWGNMKRLIGIAGDGVMLQYSVFSTRKRRSALTAVGIAQHYGAEVILFQGSLIQPPLRGARAKAIEKAPKDGSGLKNT